MNKKDINNKKLKRGIIFILLTSFFFLGLGGVYASDTNYGLDDTIDKGSSIGKVNLKQAFSVDSVGKNPGSFLSTRLGSVIGSVLSFVGVLFMVLIVYAGILWMVAMGNDTQVEKAKSLIVQAIIGLVIVLGAYAITSFIGSQLVDQKGVNDSASPSINDSSGDDGDGSSSGGA